MKRRRYTEKQVIEALIRTGHEIRCFRTDEIITLETVQFLEREHVVPLRLGGEDGPKNAAYTLKAAHKRQTFGNGATTANSDIGKIAKVKRITRTGKMVVVKPPIGEAPAQDEKPKRIWGSRPLESRGFDSGLKKHMDGSVSRR